LPPSIRDHETEPVLKTRKDVCNLTEIDVEQFKTHARRDQLPTFYIPYADEQNLDAVGERGWNRFSDLEVVQIAVFERLMCEMGYAKGLAPDSAKVIAFNASGAIQRIFEQEFTIDQWVGYMASRDGGQNVDGSLTEIFERIDTFCRQSAKAQPKPERIFLVNVSEIIRTLRTRAADLKISFGEEED
jgi:hypothetical protein